MSSMTIDVIYIIPNNTSSTVAKPYAAPVSKSVERCCAAQKTKTAASTISTTIPTPNANSWPVTLWK